MLFYPPPPPSPQITWQIRFLAIATGLLLCHPKHTNPPFASVCLTFSHREISYQPNVQRNISKRHTTTTTGIPRTETKLLSTTIFYLLAVLSHSCLSRLLLRILDTPPLYRPSQLLAALLFSTSLPIRPAHRAVCNHLLLYLLLLNRKERLLPPLPTSLSFYCGSTYAEEAEAQAQARPSGLVSTHIAAHLFAKGEAATPRNISNL